MMIEDDRTPEQRKTHPILIIGIDSFMSGWGKASSGNSYAAWACRPGDESRVLAWVENRGHIKRVRVTRDPYRPRGAGHCHIYVVDEGHPAIR